MDAGRLSGLMSESGQKHRFERRPITSGLPPAPDILRVRRHVSNVPQGAVGHRSKLTPYSITSCNRCVRFATTVRQWPRNIRYQADATP
jgi:hypothetical protein